MSDTHIINPESWSVDGNIAGAGLGTLNELDIFGQSGVELLTENQRLVNTSLEGLTGCSENGSHEFVRDELVYRSIPGSAKIISTYPGEQELYLTIGSPGEMEVFPGTIYLARTHLEGVFSEAKTLLASIEWYDSDDQIISADFDENTVQINSFSEVNVTGTAPDGAASAIIIITAVALEDEGFYYDDGTFGAYSNADISYGSDATINGETFTVIELTLEAE